MKKTLSLLLTLILSTAILFSSSLQVHIVESKTQMQPIPEIEDPTPGYYETSEYMIGNCSVPIIFLESNGSIDPETEDWTTEEIDKVLSEIQYALDWFSSRNPDANFSFYTEHYIIPTGYEPITRPLIDRVLWISEAMTDLGFPLSHGTCVDQMWDYVNAFRDLHNTDWCFVMFIVDSSDDADGAFHGMGYANADPGGPNMLMTYDNYWNGIESMDRVCAHEVGHIFWASDEYVPIADNAGYLNVTSIPLSGCIMDDLSWCLSEGTWGQVGWRDTDGDGIQDIVDTSPRVYYTYETSGTGLDLTGVVAVSPYPNKNDNYNWLPRNLTINKIQSIQYRIDTEEWIDATITASYKQAIVNFSFTTPPLEEGNHTIEIRACNQWGNYGNITETFTISSIQGDVNGDGTVDIYDVVTVSLAFGSTPLDPNWNILADLNNDDVVDIFDVVTVTSNFGNTT